MEATPLAMYADESVSVVVPESVLLGLAMLLPALQDLAVLALPSNFAQVFSQGLFTPLRL